MRERGRAGHSRFATTFTHECRFWRLLPGNRGLYEQRQRQRRQLPSLVSWAERIAEKRGKTTKELSCWGATLESGEAVVSCSVVASDVVHDDDDDFPWSCLDRTLCISKSEPPPNTILKKRRSCTSISGRFGVSVVSVQAPPSGPWSHPRSITRPSFPTDALWIILSAGCPFSDNARIPF